VGVGLGASGSGRLCHLDASLCCQSPLKEPSAFDLFFIFDTRSCHDPSPASKTDRFCHLVAFLLRQRVLSRPVSSNRNRPAPPTRHLFISSSTFITSFVRRPLFQSCRLAPLVEAPVTTVLGHPEPAGSASYQELQDQPDLDRHSSLRS